MTDLVKLKAANLSRWHAAKVIRGPAFTAVAQRLLDPEARAHYQDVEMVAHVPWPIIAVIHERESSQDWHGSLAQGDPWNRVSKHVPAGRGPFESWEDAAVDALVHCAPFAAKNTDWTPGGGLTLLESYNGLCYAARGVASPYVWSGTDQYHGGKYVRDGVFDAHAFDQQLGCAGLLMAMMALDTTLMPEWRE
jgi:lysozyme family protein